MSRDEMGRQRTRTGAPRERGGFFPPGDAGRGVADAPSGSGGVGVETVEPIGNAAVRASSASRVRPRDSTVPGEPAARYRLFLSLRDESASSSPANSSRSLFRSTRAFQLDASVCSDPDRARRAPARRRSARCRTRAPRPTSARPPRRCCGSSPGRAPWTLRSGPSSRAVSWTPSA